LQISFVSGSFSVV